jgi:hypothetical protein
LILDWLMFNSCWVLNSPVFRDSTWLFKCTISISFVVVAFACVNLMTLCVFSAEVQNCFRVIGSKGVSTNTFSSLCETGERVMSLDTYWLLASIFAVFKGSLMQIMVNVEP